MAIFPTYEQEFLTVDRNTKRYLVEIFDANSVPLGEFWMKSTGISFNYQGLTRDFTPQLYPLEVSFAYEVRYAHHESLLDFIAQFPEDRFLLKVYREKDTPNVADHLLFIGRFNVENIIYQDAPRPYTCTFKVSDGMNALKNNIFDSSYNASYYTLFDMFYEALASMGTKDEYAIGARFFSVSEIPYYPTGLVFADPNFKMVLKHLRIRDAVGWRDKLDEPTTFEKILKQICVSFNLRLIYMEGRFVLQHVRHLHRAQDGPVRYWNYDRDGTFIDQTLETEDIVVNQDNTAIQPIAMKAGGNWRFVPPVERICIEHKRIGEKFADGLTWNTNDEAEKAAGSLTIKDDGTSYITVRGSLYIRSTPSDAQNIVDEIHMYVIRLSFRIASAPDFTLSNKRDIASSFLSPALLHNQAHVLENASEYMNVFSSKVITVPVQTGGHAVEYGGSGQTKSFNYRTLERSYYTDLPSGTYEVFVQAELEAVYNENWTSIQIGGTAPSPNWLFFWELRNLSATAGAEDSAGSQAVVVAKYCFPDLPDEGNYKEVTLKTNLGDAPNQRNGIQWNTSDVGAGTWNDTTTWDDSMTILVLSNQLLQLSTKGMFAVHRFAKRLYQGALIDNMFSQERRYLYQGFLLLPLRGSHVSADDEYRGEFMEVGEYDITDLGVPEAELQQNPDELIPIDAPTPIDGALQPVPPPDNFVTDAEILALATLTSVAVVNDQEVNIGQGRWVNIVDPVTAASQLVQLTAPIVAGSVTMSFQEVTFQDTFPSGSPVILAEVTDFEWRSFEYQGAGGESDFPVAIGPVSDLTDIPAGEHQNWVRVARSGGGSKLFPNAALNQFHHFWVDATTQSILLPVALPLLTGEWVLVEVKIPVI